MLKARIRLEIGIEIGLDFDQSTQSSLNLRLIFFLLRALEVFHCSSAVKSLCLIELCLKPAAHGTCFPAGLFVCFYAGYLASYLAGNGLSANSAVRFLDFRDRTCYFSCVILC